MRCAICDSDIGPVPPDEVFDDHYCWSCRVAMRRVEAEGGVPARTVTGRCEEEDEFEEFDVY